MAVSILLAGCVHRSDEPEVKRAVGAVADRIAENSVAWMQHSEDGLQVRIVATANTCPQVLLNGSPIDPAERELVDPAFPAASCTVSVVPGDIVEFGQQRYDIPEAGGRIAIFADPACDMLKCDMTSFGQLAKAAAEMHPSLVVLAGDLLGDSDVCFTQPGCTPPLEDRWATWKLRFFDPLEPLLTSGTLVFARGSVHSCDGDKFEGWGHLLSPGWYPSSVMCRPVDPTIEAAVDDQTRLYSMDVTAALPPREVPGWLVTGTRELPGAAETSGFHPRLWIRPADTAAFIGDRGDGVAEILAGPAVGETASFWLVDSTEGCWRAQRFGTEGPIGEQTPCLPR